MSARVLPFDPAAHKVADVLLPWYVNGTLEKDELAFVQQHLSACARCQREVQWLRRASRSVRRWRSNAGRLHCFPQSAPPA